MSIERVGHFIEFVGDEGIRNIVRVTAIQWLCDADETAEETYMSVSNKAFLVRAPLDQVREVLLEDERLR